MTAWWQDLKMCGAEDCGRPDIYYCVDISGEIRKRCTTHMNQRVDYCGDIAFKDLDSAKVYLTKMRL